MINRIAVIVRYKEPFIDWINTSDPYDKNPYMTIETANEDNQVYLVDDKYSENFEGWLKRNYKTLFENELYGWYTDLTLWPEKRDLRRFRKWFSIEFFTVVVDLGRGSILDDDAFGETLH